MMGCFAISPEIRAYIQARVYKHMCYVCIKHGGNTESWIMQSTLFSVGWKKNVEPVEEPVEESIVSESPDPSNKKNGRFARVKTVKKWNYDWLSYEQEEGTVTKIWCKICREFPEEATRQQHNGQQWHISWEAVLGAVVQHTNLGKRKAVVLL